jgi:hypothetical protein
MRDSSCTKAVTGYRTPRSRATAPGHAQEAQRIETWKPLRFDAC